MKKFLFVLAAFAALLFGAMANAQTQINQASITSFPYVINKPGTYVLTSNITVPNNTASAFYIENVGVTLDLNGYTISGGANCSNVNGCTTSNNTYAIYAFNGPATIENGVISGFNSAIYLPWGSVHDVQIFGVGYGIVAQFATIRHNIIFNCAGIGINVSQSLVSDNSVSYCISYGIYAINSSVLNNVVYGSKSWGLNLSAGYASGNSLLANTGDLYLTNNAVTTKSNACTNGPC